MIARPIGGAWLVGARELMTPSPGDTNRLHAWWTWWFRASATGVLGANPSNSEPIALCKRDTVRGLLTTRCRMHCSRHAPSRCASLQGVAGWHRRWLGWRRVAIKVVIDTMGSCNQHMAQPRLLRCRSAAFHDTTCRVCCVHCEWTGDEHARATHDYTWCSKVK